MPFDEGRLIPVLVVPYRYENTLPVPPSPTRTSLKVGIFCCSAMIFDYATRLSLVFQLSMFDELRQRHNVGLLPAQILQSLKIIKRG